MFCMHTYPYYGIVSATGDVAIKKPKVRMMDFHGLSLRPLVVKGLKHSRNNYVNTGIIPLTMKQTREFKLSICLVIWVFIFIFILHLAKEYLQP